MLGCKGLRDRTTLYSNKKNHNHVNFSKAFTLLSSTDWIVGAVLTNVCIKSKEYQLLSPKILFLTFTARSRSKYSASCSWCCWRVASRDTASSSGPSSFPSPAAFCLSSSRLSSSFKPTPSRSIASCSSAVSVISSGPDSRHCFRSSWK